MDEVIRILTEKGSMFGADLRRELNRPRRWWRRYSTAGFYVLMAKLEDHNIVYGSWVNYQDGTSERRYRLRNKTKIR